MVTTVVTFGIAIVIISMIAYYSYVATIVTRSVAIVVIEVLVYVDFNIRASYTVVPVFCVVIRPFSLGSMGCPTLCDPIDGSPPGSPVPGILQARTLE